MIIAFCTCKEPFISPSTNNSPSYLVVDGFIQGGDGEATIALGRTRNLNDSSNSSPESRAKVTLVGSTSGVFTFSETSTGKYIYPNLPIDFSQSYQLFIRTSDGKEYASDTIIPKQSPTIDSLHWDLSHEGLNISVTTHDPSANTRYYRWEYTETWEHRSNNSSYIRYIGNGQFANRSPDQQISRCWTVDTLTDILVGSSESLKQDVIFQQPIKFIPQGDGAIAWVYSVIVYQFALSKEGYEYWVNLKKNTELRGTLFDPQPSQVNGNMRCLSNPDEHVLGYVSAGSVTSQRLVILNKDLAYWNYVYPYTCPDPVEVPLSEADRYFSDTILYTPLSITLGAVSTTNPECGDCRYQGGTNQQPAYMP